MPPSYLHPLPDPDALNSTALPDRLMFLPDVAAWVGVNPATIRKWADDPDSGFPKPVVLNPHTKNPRLAWRVSDLLRWLEGLQQGRGRAPQLHTPEVKARAAAATRARFVNAANPAEDDPPVVLRRPRR